MILQKLIKYLKKLTFTRGKLEILSNREVLPSLIREVSASAKPVVDSLVCPYCASKDFFRRGFRQKRSERVQLYQCNSCGKTFTPHAVKGKHYPLSTIFDAISLYNLGYSLEESCRIVNEKRASVSGSSLTAGSNVPASDTRGLTLPQYQNFVKWMWRKAGGTIPSSSEPERVSDASPSYGVHLPTTENIVAHNKLVLHPSSLSNWLAEFGDNCRFLRMREFAIKKYSPKEMVIYATLAHRQLYRFRFHQAKCELMINEEFQHRKFTPLKEFLEMVPAECPHQYFMKGLRASEVPLTFSKTAMIVRGKTNFATKTTQFVLQSVKDRKLRHEALQKFMLYNDSVTVATEVPVYLTKDDLEHMKTQLGFELFGEMPKLITGHIDILQVRNGQIHILDYKPNAEKERPIEQLTLYAMALSRLTGLRLFEFKCAWFDEKDYFEFYPLHVLYKPKKARRRRQVATQEGIYSVNKEVNKIKNVKPTPYV